VKWLKSVLGLNRKLNLRLLDAAESGDADMIRKLLAEGADKKAKDKDGWTPLHHAAGAGHQSAAQVLVQAGADKEAKDNDGYTPLNFGRTEKGTALWGQTSEPSKDDEGWRGCVKNAFLKGASAMLYQR
jgi:ankyrin repeat protein